MWSASYVVVRKVGELTRGLIGLWCAYLCAISCVCVQKLRMISVTKNNNIAIAAAAAAAEDSNNNKINNNNNNPFLIFIFPQDEQ